MSIPLSQARGRSGCLWFLTSGSISMMVITDRGGYHPGKSIDISVNVENNGSRRIIAIQAMLIKTLTFIARNGIVVRLFKQTNSHYEKSGVC